MVCKNYLFFNKKGYIKENIKLTMNLKERGITVGDLLIIFIVIITATISFKTLNKDKKSNVNVFNQEELLLNSSLSSKNHLNYLII